MTPEQAQEHLLMLRLGEYEEYDRALDQLLLEEDPLSPLTLELACCMSDREKTISVLREFLLDHPAEKQPLMEKHLDYVRSCYAKKAMTSEEAVRYLHGLLVASNYEDPWCCLYEYMDIHDLYIDGIISREDFETSFEALLLRGEWLPWQPQKKQKGIKP